ncbi:uncharacterized protein HGUI_02262 [Hanseniaspora guilliermondii]|uniref:Uncharacterized protein n=1 Tax=Hanseniaspora guilliermondii TaxID=56406 RepID=A0A1L0FKE8_9ASCO|nr:uncharacterized protein HGUI_02262 [Hanseniaspora guilliermondii]
MSDNNLLYHPSDEYNTQIYELLLHYLVTNDHIFNTVDNNSTQVVLDKIINIILSDKIIDKLKYLDQELNIQFDPSNKKNFDVYNRLYQICNNISDYRKKVNLPSNRYDLEGGNVDVFDDEIEDKFISVIKIDDEDKDIQEDDDDEVADPNIYHLPETIDEINEHNVYNYLVSLFNMENESQEKNQKLVDKIINVILTNNDTDDLSKNLHSFINISKLRLIPNLMNHKDIIYYGLRYHRSFNDEEKLNIIEEIKEESFLQILPKHYKLSKRKLSDEDTTHIMNLKKQKKSQKLLNINKFKLPKDDSDLIKRQEIVLPENSYKVKKNGYTELHIPAPEKLDSKFRLISISDLPEWSQKVFPSNETSSLNRIQSEVFPAVFHTNQNVLVCAPTGAGKTNIAMLSALQTISKHISNEKKGIIDSNNNSFKIVYIAPLRALVQEQVLEFQRRLKVLGIRVVELTGDSETSRRELENAHMIISTPEKWDIISRKFHNQKIIQKVELMILDEVHLLHEERGPIIEAISMRMMKNNTRIVALSATLPNYQDVADFLKVNKTGLFFFTPNYRPCPLKQEFISVNSLTSVKELININKACYDKVKENLQNKHQVIVFVHSRKDTLKTAQYFLQQIKNDEEFKSFVDLEDPAIQNILNKEAKENCDDPQLANMIKNGIALHHAGLSRNDRSQSEDLFADGVIRLLISTKTISWGVNLPAHTVIIKGTDIYSPALNKLVKLSIQDMLQMLGRAGRPRYDTFGEGIIITNKEGVDHYLSLLMGQQNIESRFMDRLIDLVNAEICAGSIIDKDSLTTWLKSSYWYVRMMKNRKLYKTDGLNIDVFLNSLADTIIDSLMNYKMVDLTNDDIFKSTELASIASDFYISCSAVYDYYNDLNKDMTLIEIFSLFSKSSEFENMIVRPEEKYEMRILLNKLPIPVKESLDDIGCKPNVLLQSYISRLPMDGLSLNSDMIFIKQNSVRLIQALFQISKLKHLSRVTNMLLNVYMYTEKRVWITETPLRQMNLSPEILKLIERSNIDWDLILEKDNEDVLDSFYEMASNLKQYENVLDEALLKFPRLNDIKVSVQTITKTFYRINVLFTPDIKWDHKLHGNHIKFLMFLTDYNGDEIFHEESINVKKYHVQNEISLSFDIELLYPNLPPNLFVVFKAERWLHCEYKVPVMFMNKIKQIESSLPQPTLVDNESINKKKKYFSKEIEKLNVPEFNNIIKNDVNFIEGSNRKSTNEFENEALQIILKTNENLFYCTTMIESKVMLAKMAFLKAYERGVSRIVYVNDDNFILNEICNWLENHYPHNNELKINKLGDDLDNKFLFNRSHIVLSSFKNFELISREWKHLNTMKEIGYFIVDNVETVFDANDLDRGYLFEELISRLSLLQTQFDEINTRFICFSDPLTNYYEVGEWIGVERDNCFCYNNEAFINEMHVNVKLLKYEQSSIVDFITDRAIINLLTNEAFSLKSKKKAPVIYTLSRNESLTIAESILSKCVDLRTNIDFEKIGGVSDELLSMFTDTEIAKYFMHGIFIFYESMDADDHMILKKFARACKMYLTDGFYIFKTNIAMIVKTRKIIESDNSLTSHGIRPHLVTKILSCCDRDSDLTFITDEYSKIQKLLSSAQYSVESSLPYHFAETLINEIRSGVITKKSDVLEWLPYTFLNTRLHKNPSYYGVNDNSVFKLSKFVTTLLNQSLSELESMGMLEYEEEEFKLDCVSNGVYKYGLVLDDLQLLKENFFSIKSDIHLLQLVSSLPSLEKDLSICYENSFQQAERHIGNIKALKQYRDRMPPLSFKVFGLLYCLLYDVDISILPLTLQLDAKAVYKNLLTLSFKIFKFLVVLIEHDKKQKIQFKVLKAVSKLIKGLHLEIGTFKQKSTESDSLKQIPYIDEAKIKLLESEGVTSVESIIRNNLHQRVNDEQDEDIDDFFAKFPLATIKDINLNTEDHIVIELSNIVSTTEEDGINYTGDYYCVFYTEEEEDIYHVEPINQDEAILKVNKSLLPSNQTILVELINDSFITERQLKKIYT